MSTAVLMQAVSMPLSRAAWRRSWQRRSPERFGSRNCGSCFSRNWTRAIERSIASVACFTSRAIQRSLRLPRLCPPRIYRIVTELTFVSGARSAAHAPFTRRPAPIGSW